MKDWTFLVTLSSMVCVATLQYAVPMFAGPPVVPLMLPAVAVGIPQQRDVTVLTTPTTTTTVRSVAVAVPVPLPVPVQFPMPVYAQPSFCQASPRPTGCPPCPPCLCMPSCTPAFFSFCSPCHQKCRCRGPGAAPIPMPANPPVALSVPVYPAPAPPPLLVMPIPSVHVAKTKSKHKTKQHSWTDTSDESEESSSDTSTDSDYYYKRGRKRKKSQSKHKHQSARRSGDGEPVRPLLTYVSRNGHVKFKKKISNAQAARLLDSRSGERGGGGTGDVAGDVARGAGGGPRLLVVSQGADRIALREGASQHTLQRGRKEIIFRPPANKRIGNLSVSFQVTE